MLKPFLPLLLSINMSEFHAIQQRILRQESLEEWRSYREINEEITGAIDSNDMKHLKKLLASSPPEVIQGPFVGMGGDSLVVYAARKSNITVIKLLLLHGAHVDDANENGMTALMIAAHEGCARMMQFLLNQGARVDFRDDNGHTALMYAAGNLGLIESGSETESQLEGCILLAKLCIHCNKAVIDLLINTGADVNAQDNDEKTALMHAASRFGGAAVAVGTMKDLIEHGANVNTKDKHGWTALGYAVRYDIARIKVLVENGADVNAKSNYGTTILMECIENTSEDEEAEAVRFLTASGANATVMNERDHNRTAIDYAKPEIRAVLQEAIEAGTKEYEQYLEDEKNAYLERQRQAKQIIEQQKQLAPVITNIVTDYAYGAEKEDLPGTKEKSRTWCAIQ